MRQGCQWFPNSFIMCRKNYCCGVKSLIFLSAFCPVHPVQCKFLQSHWRCDMNTVESMIFIWENWKELLDSWFRNLDAIPWLFVFTHVYTRWGERWWRYLSILSPYYPAVRFHHIAAASSISSVRWIMPLPHNPTKLHLLLFSPQDLVILGIS